MQKHHSYSGLLHHAANVLGEDVLVKKTVSYVSTRKYTGTYITVVCQS